MSRFVRLWSCLIMGTMLWLQPVQAGVKKKVLFIGNSYTDFNNLPQIIASMAAVAGDTLVFDKEVPGGFSLNGHSTNTATLNKIMQGGWDYVVLQEQSQLPSFPETQVLSGVFPYARKLDSLIRVYNSCATTLFYMTWGRKNGDASNCPTWPPVCTYMGMDSLLRLRYLMMADSNDAELAPVGAVWRYLRQHHPSIDLYQSDESHPSQAGSFAGACAFYSAIFRKSPLNVNYNYTLNATVAGQIRAAAKVVVFDSLQHWYIGTYDPVAAFSFSQGPVLSVSFSNLSQRAVSYNWDFGDGNTSTSTSPAHTYANPGSYQVKLISGDCGKYDTASVLVQVFPTAVAAVADTAPILLLYPNPAKDLLHVAYNGSRQGPAEITITDPAGKMLLQTSRLLTDSFELDIRSLPPGNYLLSVAGPGREVHHGRFSKR